LTFSLLVVTVGGMVEIAPLFWLENTIEEVEGVRPYSPLELTGRDIYIREGCYVCHSQMIRPMRDEVERYGHYSLAAESMYDHPFQWGSKRTSDFMVQADPDGDWDAMLERYPGAAVSNFDGQPELTEMDALIAYLQVLGTMVDFSTFTPDASR